MNASHFKADFRKVEDYIEYQYLNLMVTFSSACCLFDVSSSK